MSPRGTEGLHRVWALVRAWPSNALHLWRRSLRIRVVTAIVVLSAVVVGSVGFMVMRQISSGLVKGRVDSSVAEARTETSTARELLNSAGGSDYDPETQLRLLAENLVSRGEVKGFDVVVRGPVGDGQHRRRRTHHARGRHRERPGQPAHDRGGRRRATASPGPTPGSATLATSTTRPGRRARSGGRLDRGAALRRRHLRALLPVPDERGAADAAAPAPGAADRGHPPAAARRRSRCPGDAPGDQPCPARPPRRGTDRLRAARGADARRGGGRHRPTRDVVQPDGRGAPVPDPQAGGALPRAAHLRLRRLPRAAHAADDGADGRRRAARRPRELRPGDGAGGRAAADRARPVREPARRPARDQPLRRRRRGARARRHQPRRRRPPGGGHASRRWRCSGASRCGSWTTACSWSRPTYAGSSGSSATC